MKNIILSLLILSINVNLISCAEITNEYRELNDTIMSFPNFVGRILLVTYVIIVGIFHISRYYSNLKNSKKTRFLIRSALFINIFICFHKSFFDIKHYYIFRLILFAFNIGIHIYIWQKTFRLYFDIKTK